MRGLTAGGLGRPAGPTWPPYLPSEHTLGVLQEHDQVRRRDRRPAGHRHLLTVAASGPAQAWRLAVTCVKSRGRGAFRYLFMVFWILMIAEVAGCGSNPGESAEQAGILIIGICPERQRIARSSDPPLRQRCGNESALRPGALPDPSLTAPAPAVSTRTLRGPSVPTGRYRWSRSLRA